MTERTQQLHATADGQIATMIELLAGADPASLHQPCPGREKLGDGTIGALLAHTVDNYERIGAFVATADRITAGGSGRHRVPRFARALGHRAREHDQHGPRFDGHAHGYTADNADPADLVRRLSAARTGLEKIAELTEGQLDTIPPKDSFRFCDGQRTLEQVLSSLLKHQGRQLEPLTAAIG